jgi:hypothetical protein
MVDFKEDAWLYALIAGILGLIGILIPWDSNELFFGVTQYNWLGGLVYNIDGDWVGGDGLNIWTLGLTAFSIVILLIYSINTWRGKEFKWDWLMYILTGIVLVLFPILTLVLESAPQASTYGSILVIISGVFAIGAFVVDKFIGRE